MEKLYCAYCGELLEDGCSCERELVEYEVQVIEDLEERQHQSGFMRFRI